MNRTNNIALVIMLLFQMLLFPEVMDATILSSNDTIHMSYKTQLSEGFVTKWNSLSSEGVWTEDVASLFSDSDISETSIALFQDTEFDDIKYFGVIDASLSDTFIIEAECVVDSMGDVLSILLGVQPVVASPSQKSALLANSSSLKSGSQEIPSLKSISVPTVVKSGTYSGGDGSALSPYQIASRADLIELSLSSADWDKHFIQTANIIFSSDYISEDWNADGLINYSDEIGMQSIGTSGVPFSGEYDGGSFRIKYLLNNSDEDNCGMFGYCDGASLKNIGLAQANISGWNYVGALVGYCNTDNNISNCYTTGTVSGFRYVGGLIGYIKSSTVVDQSISTCIVDGFLYVAGFVGRVRGKDVVISNSVSAGSVEGVLFTGGLIGSSGSATVENVYSSTEVDGVIASGGLIGNSGNGDVTDAYWDVDASGIASSGGSDAQGLTSEEMADSSIFEDWDTAVWTFDPELNGGLPVLEDQSDFYEPVETEFVGSGSWDDPDNWTNGVPDSEEITTVIISGECDLTDSIAVENLIVSIGGVLNVDDNGSVTVEDDLIITSDASGSGEFYSSVSEGVDSVEQEIYFKGGQWSFISTPVTIKADDILPKLHMATSWGDPLGEYWVVEYSESKRARLGSGMQDIYDGDHLIEAGKGYMVWVDTDQVVSYKHVLSSGNSEVETSLSVEYEINHRGWNLVGNPFTYTLTYDDVFDCEYNKESFTGAVYLWDGIGYKTWVDGIGDEEASVISPLEAFFVKKTNASDEYFYLGKGDCTPVGVKSSKVPEVESSSYEVLDIQIESEEGIDNTYLKVLPPEGQGCKAQKFELANAYKPLIFSRSDDDEACAINSVVVDSVRNIPLSLSLVDANSAFTLSFSGQMSDLYKYTLYDAFEGAVYPLEDSIKLSFSTEANAFISDRFTVSVERLNPELETSIIYNEVDQEALLDVVSVVSGVVLRSLSEEALSVRVFDMNGRAFTTLTLEQFEQKQLNLSQGIYLLEVRSTHQRSTIKVSQF